MEKRKLTVASFRKMKNNQEKIVMVTAYDAPGAAIAAAAGVMRPPFLRYLRVSTQI